jgi:hypothetical protein
MQYRRKRDTIVAGCVTIGRIVAGFKDGALQ